jgi:hypothetical protein
MYEARDIERFRYSELLEFLDGFDPWLLGLGLSPRADDRIHEAFKILRKAEEASCRGRATGVYTEIEPEDWFPIVEAMEAYNIYTAFHKDSSPVPAETLKRALSGPLQPMDENQKNRDGRNIWFELALAAEWKLRGASVRLEEPDMRLIRDGIPVSGRLQATRQRTEHRCQSPRRNQATSGQPRHDAKRHLWSCCDFPELHFQSRRQSLLRGDEFAQTSSRRRICQTGTLPPFPE